MIYSRDLSVGFELDISALKQVQESYNNLDQMMIFKMSTVDKNLLRFLDALDLYVSHSEIFYTPPKGKLPIHVDHDEFSNRCKLNWVFGAEGSRMIWWEKKPGVELKYHTTPIKTRYLMFDQADCIQLYSAEINQPSLVNVGVPHSVDNMTDQGRWCMSYVIGKKKDHTNLQWDEAQTIFNDYFEE